MAEYIEREALYKEVTEKYHDINGGQYPFNVVAYDMAQLVKSAPTADVVEVVHGEWTNIRDYGDYCLGHCSVCWAPQEVAFPSALKEGFRYCRWCGAKMDGKGD